MNAQRLDAGGTDYTPYIAAGATALSQSAQALAQSSVNKENVALAREQMSFNAFEAEKSRRRAQQNQESQNIFAERMSNTAHQREMQDLKLAGLNPILTAMGGGGASSSGAGSGPQVAQATGGGAPKVESILGGLNPNSAFEAAKTISATNLARAQEIGVAAQTLNSVASAKKTNEEATQLRYGREGAETRGKYDKAKAQQDIDYLPYDGLSKRVIEGMSAITNALNPIKGLIKPSLEHRETYKGYKKRLENEFNTNTKNFKNTPLN